MSTIITLEPQLDSFAKGRQFEEYVISLFNKQFFNLIEWRKSEKINNPSRRVNYSYPDLELTFGHYNNYRFAVECKWRKDWSSLSIWWATKNKVCAYQDFQNSYDMPVFIAIGVGGRPSKPESLFVVPVYHTSLARKINKTNLEKKFRRNTQRKFYYDPTQLMLF